MASLMCHNPSSSPEKLLIIGLINLLLKESRVIPRKRKNPSPLPNTRKSKHKIPLIFRIQIGKGHSNQAKSIRPETFPQIIEYMFCIVLLFLCVVVDATVNALEDVGLFQDLDFQGMEECLAELFQGFYEIWVDLFLEWFYVDYVALLVDLVVQLAFVRVVGLALFLMVPEPVAFFGLADWVEERDHLLEGFLDSVGQAGQTADGDLPGLSIGDLKIFLHGQIIRFISQPNHIQQKKNSQQNPSITPQPKSPPPQHNLSPRSINPVQDSQIGLLAPQLTSLNPRELHLGQIVQLLQLQS